MAFKKILLCFGFFFFGFLPYTSSWALSDAAKVCSTYEHQLVSYLDLLYYVKSCELRLIDDVDIANKMIFRLKKTVVVLNRLDYNHLRLSNKKYLLKNFNEDFGFHDSRDVRCISQDAPKGLFDDHFKTAVDRLKSMPSSQKLCQGLNGKIGFFYTEYFLIQDCRLNRIKDFSLDLQQKAARQNQIVELTLEQRFGLKEK